MTIEFIKENIHKLLPRLLSQYRYEFVRFLDLCAEYDLKTKSCDYIRDLEFYGFSRLNYIVDSIVECDINNLLCYYNYDINDFDNLDEIDRNNMIKTILYAVQCRHYSIFEDDAVQKYITEYGLKSFTVIKTFYKDFIIHLLSHIWLNVNNILEDNFVCDVSDLRIYEVTELVDLWEEIEEDLLGLGQINKLTIDVFKSMKDIKFGLYKI